MATDAAIITESIDWPAAFGEIYDRHASVLLGYLVRRVGQSEAEGLLGELFRIAFEKRATFDVTRPNARPWLYGIAARLILKHYRSTGRQSHAMTRLASVRTDDSDPFDEAIVDRADRSQQLAQTLAAINRLPEADREVLLLFAWEGLSYGLIAEALDIPVGTVRSRLNRIREHLREPRATSGKEPDNIPRGTGGANR